MSERPIMLTDHQVEIVRSLARNWHAKTWLRLNLAEDDPRRPDNFSPEGARAQLDDLEALLLALGDR